MMHSLCLSGELFRAYPIWTKLFGGGALPRILKTLCLLNGQDRIGIPSEEQVEVAVEEGSVRFPSKDDAPGSWTPDKWLTTRYGLCCNVNLKGILHLIL